MVMIVLKWVSKVVQCQDKHPDPQYRAVWSAIIEFLNFIDLSHLEIEIIKNEIIEVDERYMWLKYDWRIHETEDSNKKDIMNEITK